MDSQNQPNFDFIMSSPNQKKGRLPMNSKKQRLITVVVGAIIVITVVSVGWNIISGSLNKSNDQVLDLIAYQAELKRIIALGNERARSASTLNKSLTATYTLETDYQRSLRMMTSRGIKPPKDLTARYSGTQNDQALDAAEKVNAFDAKYEEIYVDKLTKYKAKLAEIYPALKPAEQAVIKNNSNNAKLLLGEPITTTQN